MRGDGVAAAGGDNPRTRWELAVATDRLRGARRGEEGRPPSPAAVRRLSHHVRGELRDLESDLAGELLTALLLIRADDPRGARRVMDAQSTRLRLFEARVQRAIAGAVAEREAEEVVAAACSARRWRGHPRRPTRASPLRSGLLTAAAAAVALVIAFAAPTPLPEFVAGMAWNGQRPDAPTVPGVTEHGGPVGEDAASLSTATAPGGGGSAVERVGGDAEALDALRLVGQPGRILARLARDARRGPVAALLGVDDLVAQLVTEAVPDEVEGRAEDRAARSAEPAPQPPDPGQAERPHPAEADDPPPEDPADPADPAGPAGIKPGDDPSDGGSPSPPPSPEPSPSFEPKPGIL